jgi:hypothetical protein
LAFYRLGKAIPVRGDDFRLLVAPSSLAVIATAMIAFIVKALTFRCRRNLTQGQYPTNWPAAIVPNQGSLRIAIQSGFG